MPGSEPRTRLNVTTFRHSPLSDFLVPFRKAQSQWVARYIIVLFAVIIRCAVGLGPYSGKGTPPMFGDFEAQRHWLEITTHLPIKKWYRYDLGYWGLDYPPLTAFHSWFLGKVGGLIDASWFELDASRGIEAEGLKSFMRITVILSELVCYVPGVLWYSRWMGRFYTHISPIDQTVVAAAILFQPCLIIIDHGHFQYNCVMLGLALLSWVSLLYDDYAIGAIFFVLSLGFKQMALYYAPVVFAYLLSVCCWPLPNGFNILRLCAVGTATLSTFAVLLAPFVLTGGFSEIGQILHRVFPFARGIFEDKVASFWCATNTFVKYRSVFSLAQLQLLSLVFTLIGLLPAVVIIFLHPRKHLLTWALAGCSWSFYLFSFQVHEKSVLLPLLPTTLLLAEADHNTVSMVSWINNIGLFSLWPLLQKDGLALQYFVLGVLSNWLLGNLNWISKWLLPGFLIPGPVLGEKVSRQDTQTVIHTHWSWSVIVVTSYIGIAALHAIEFYLDPPRNYPDLWVIGNVTLSFGCFTLFWLWVNYRLFMMRNKKLKTQ
ncbi:unnamed protein product [Kuraishia capsulata CBS 1993]|uniref:Alpha-1,3-glucosyltransferase n=1 Tax=Kuraishia capsulata CBS 1993 TaxID=1382522 RepID=W6MUD2_9ASCO|nr:uncharacterized protein KUCA_T00005134001 [Kuraishia capsulata CBS 1993]CDK29147.1 unnamed protein product [Kuraishia capsulata CBS 1993]